MTETGPFTELNSRRLGPVRRFFVRRPRVMDALIVVFVVGMTSISDAGSGSTRPFVVALAFGIASGGALAWRRAHSLIVTGAVIAFGVLSLATTGSFGGLELALGFGIYAVATSKAAQTAWIAASGAVLISAAAVWVWEEPSPDPIERRPDGTVVLTDDRWGQSVAILMIVLAAMAIGISVRNRRDHLADLMNRANALAIDRDRQAQLARASERSRIAREMHDVVAHSLSVMITLADGAAATLDRTPERSRAALTELTSTGRAALADMRRVLGALHDGEAPLEPTGQGQDLPALVDRFRAAGLQVRANGLLLDPPADTGVRMALYRVVQESLTNVLRHAQGTPHVDLELGHGATGWNVTVTDQGGIVPTSDAGGAGLGLVGMQERVELLGGSVEAGIWEQGWRVHVVIPDQEATR